MGKNEFNLHKGNEQITVGNFEYENEPLKGTWVQNRWVFSSLKSNHVTSWYQYAHSKKDRTTGRQGNCMHGGSPLPGTPAYKVPQVELTLAMTRIVKQILCPNSRAKIVERELQKMVPLHVI